jgi:hypothetical protein
MISDWGDSLLRRQKETDKTDITQTLYYKLEVTICTLIGKYVDRK